MRNHATALMKYLRYWERARDSGQGKLSDPTWRLGFVWIVLFTVFITIFHITAYFMKVKLSLLYVVASRQPRTCSRCVWHKTGLPVKGSACANGALDDEHVGCPMFLRKDPPERGPVLPVYVPRHVPKLSQP